MKHFLYVIGEPGTGKSTLVEQLTAGYEAQERDVPFAHRWHPGTFPEAVVELGARRDQFGGTDALAMNVQPRVEQYLATTEHNLVLAEGDRLANPKFFDAAIEAGWKLLIARLYVKPRTALARRQARGSRQDASWVKSRATKVERLAATFPERVIHVRHEDGDTELALLLLRERSPVAAAFA